MNIEIGSFITCKKGKKAFRALVTDSWYNERGFHLFRLEVLKRRDYNRTPKSVWYSRNLYKFLTNMEYDEKEALNAGGARFHKLAGEVQSTGLVGRENIIEYFNKKLR